MFNKIGLIKEIIIEMDDPLHFDIKNENYIENKNYKKLKFS